MKREFSRHGSWGVSTEKEKKKIDNIPGVRKEKEMKARERRREITRSLLVPYVIDSYISIYLAIPSPQIGKIIHRHKYISIHATNTRTNPRKEIYTHERTERCCLPREETGGIDALLLLLLLLLSSKVCMERKWKWLEICSPLSLSLSVYLSIKESLHRITPSEEEKRSLKDIEEILYRHSLSDIRVLSIY